MSKPVQRQPAEPPVKAEPDGASRLSGPEALGVQLRAMFESLETAPVPQALESLVNQLEAKRRGVRHPRRS